MKFLDEIKIFIRSDDRLLVSFRRETNIPLVSLMAEMECRGDILFKSAKQPNHLVDFGMYFKAKSGLPEWEK